MAIREISFPSYNGRDTIMGWIYTPIVSPRGIIQIIHGFGEHSRRYLHMILKMTDAGYIVCADDHVGHGKTAFESDTWGDFGTKGYRTTTEDEHTLRQMLTREFPDLPYFVFGHSWGSMIARNYMAHYGQGLAAATICGTVAMLPQFAQLHKDLAELVGQGRGAEVDPQYMGRMFAGMTDRYDNPLTPNDWISGDPNVVKDHGLDPFNNLQNPPNIQSLYDFTCLLEAITGEEWAAKVPLELPVYNIAGDQDPVGNYGEGVYAVSNWLFNTGHKRVKTRMYPGHRHEIHNDRDIREAVEEGILSFFNSAL